MGATTGIEWIDHTFNAWIGCTRVSEGCRNCYAERQNAHWKYNGGAWGPGAERKVTSAANWREPLKWAKAARVLGVREKVFCNSLSDTFDLEAPRQARKDLWSLIGDTFDALDWQLVTKRPENILPALDDDGMNYGFFEVCKCWLMTTVENQGAVDVRIPQLLDVPAAVHGVSCEPLLGPVDLFHFVGNGTRKPNLDWVIAGGESGPGAREMQAAWARNLRDECVVSLVPFFFKQWGDFNPGGKLGNERYLAGWRYEKKGGAVLDGREWKEFPEVQR